MKEIWVWSLGQKNPLEKRMATHSSIFSWRIPWTEEPGRLQSMGSKRVRHDWVTDTSEHMLFRAIGLDWKCFPGDSDGKSICLQCGRPRFNPWVRKIPWRRKWQPTSELLPEKSHGWRSLVGYSPWGHKELDMTKPLHFSFFLSLSGMKSSREWEETEERINPWSIPKARVNGEEGTRRKVVQKSSLKEENPKIPALVKKVFQEKSDLQGQTGDELGWGTSNLAQFPLSGNGRSWHWQCLFQWCGKSKSLIEWVQERL